MRTRRAVQLLGVVSAMVFVVGGVLAVATYESLREGPLPAILAVDMVVLACVLWTARSLELGRPAALSRWGSALAIGGLFIVFGFFVAVVLFGGLTDRVPEWIATLGTFVASAASLLGLPLGLLLFAVASLSEVRLPSWARPLPLIATSMFIVIPIAIAVLPEGRREGQVAAILLAVAGSAWAIYIFGMSSSLRPNHDR